MVLKLENVSGIVTEGGLSKCTPIFAGNELIKVGTDGVRISIVKHVISPKNVTVLLGHEKPILTMALSHDNSILCSCSEDKIILWDLVSSKYVYDGVDNKGVVIGENIGYVLHCSISRTKKWLALCQVKEIWIILLTEMVFQSGKDDGFYLHTILKTDSNQVNMCSFSSQFLDILVTVEDSNHFQVWDLLSSNLIYRSSNLVNNYITCCSFSGSPNKLLIGTSKGIALVYNFSDKCMPSYCMAFNITEKDFMDKTENVAGKGALFSKANDLAKKEEGLQLKKGCVILSLTIYNTDETCDETERCELDNDTLRVAEKILASIISLGSVLVTCCNLGIIVHDCKSCDCIGFLSFSDQMITKALPLAQLHLIDYVILAGESLKDMQCCIKTPFSQQKLYLLKLYFEKPESELLNSAPSKCGSDLYLSFLPSLPLSKKSPLRYNAKLNGKSTYSSEQLKVGISHNVKIKSSGYGKCPRTKMFSPITNTNKNSKIPLKSGKTLGIYHTKRFCNEKNVLNYGPPENIDKNVLICETTGTVSKLAYSGNGDFIACSSATSQICILPADKLQLDKSIGISGHDSCITSLDFNLNSKWLLSSSSDSTVRVWNWRNRKSILKIETESKSTSNIKLVHSVSPVTQARFFYLDKFILLAKKDKIDLYHHFLHKENSPTNWSTEDKGCHKVKSIFFPTQTVTCFSAANQFHSCEDLVMGGCSNRDIMVYDLNHQKFVCTLKEAHIQRPPHSLVQLTGSTCPSIPALTPGAYNLVISSAILDGVKLWDLRTQRCVQKYNRHLNRVYTSGIDFSACGRFVAVCSEDKRVYVYDTRDCENYICTLGGFTDAVMDVAFSPCMTQLAASSLNGNMLTFKPRI